MDKLKKYLFASIVCVCTSSCTINYFAIRKNKRQESQIEEAAKLIYSRGYDQLEVKNLRDTILRTQLTQMGYQWFNVHYSLGDNGLDSVVVFKRWGNPIAVIEVLCDISKKERTESIKSEGWKKIGDKIFYRKRSWIIS